MRLNNTYRSYSVTRFAIRSTWILLGISLISALLMPVRAQILPSLGGERAGTSGYQFLKIPVDARSAALGEAVVASAFDASSLFWNPALAAQLDGLNVGFFHTAYFVDVNLEFAALSYRLPNSGFTIGGSIQTLNSGEMNVTTEFQPFGTGQKFRLTDVAAGLTVAQQLTDLFSYGVTGKYIQESVAGISTSSVVFDVGIFYRIGTTGAQMAVSVRSFGFDGTPSGSIDRTVIGSESVVVESDFESLTPPTTFHMGLVYDVLTGNPSNTLKVSAQLNNPNDNSENWNFGVEYGWHDTLILRTGYRFGIEEYSSPSFGIGLNIPYLGPDFRFDYGFNRLERLGNVHRIGFNIAY